MSLTKRLKDILENGPIEERYLAACFLVDGESELDHFAQRYNLHPGKLRRIYDSIVPGGTSSL